MPAVSEVVVVALISSLTTLAAGGLVWFTSRKFKKVESNHITADTVETLYRSAQMSADQLLKLQLHILALTASINELHARIMRLETQIVKLGGQPEV